MQIILGTDHAGFELKEKIKAYLKQLGYQVSDQGAFAYDENDDYPDFVRLVALQVGSDPENMKGIILGGSGQGEAIVANRVKNVRAAVYYGGSEEIIRLSRQHNDANVLSLGARFIEAERALEIVKMWLDTPFSGEEKHKRRINKIDSEAERIEEF